MLYIVCLYIYKQNVNDNGYTFPKSFKVQDFLIKALKKDEITQNSLRIIFDQQAITPPSTAVMNLESWGKGFKDRYSKPRQCFYNTEMKDVMCDKYPNILNDFANTPNAKINVQVNWNLLKRKEKQTPFRNVMQKVFTDEGDHRFFDKLMNRNSTIIVSIEVENTVSKLKKIIAFASLTKIQQGREVILVIVDYFAVSDDKAFHYLPYFNYERFKGKGIGKFVLNLVQVISNTLCNNKENMVLLKCTEDPKSFYELIGFEEITSDSDILAINEVKKHYNEIKHSADMFDFILKSNTVIDHLKKNFINHVEQLIDGIDFAKVYKDKIWPKIHKVFDRTKFYMEMRENLSDDYNQTDEIAIPIGKIIEHFMSESKPTGYEHFLKLYKFMFSNLVWAFEKSKEGWNLCSDCNLCGKLLCHKIPLKTSKKFKLEESKMRGHAKGLVECVIKHHFKFECSDSKDK